MHSEFENFCGGVLWDGNLTWNNATWPEFTLCFRTTVLSWVPSAILWLTLPLNLYYMIKFRGVRIPASLLTKAKIVISFILAALYIIDIITTYSANDNVVPIPDSYYVSSAIKAATMILSILLFYLEVRLGFITSGIQFMFWLFLLLTNIVTFYTIIFYYQDGRYHLETRSTQVGLFFTQFAFILTQFILQFRAEKLQLKSYKLGAKSPCPEIKASFFSRITFWWLNSVVITGYRKTLDESDLWELNPRDKSTVVVPEFQKAWKKEVNYARKLNKNASEKKFSKSSFKNGDITEKTPILSARLDQMKSSGTFDKKSDPVTPASKASLFKVMTLVYGPTLCKAVFFKLVYDVLVFANPQVLKLLIAFTEDKNIAYWKGFVYIVALFLCALIQSALFHQCFHVGITLGMRIKSAAIAAIYRKSLVMNSEARKTSTVGEIVNLMSVDAQRLQDITGYLWMLISCPIQIAVSMVFLYLTLGPAAFAGLAVLVLLIPINGVLAYLMRKYQVKQMAYKDTRIKLINEVLNGIKVLKLYAWEKSFEQKISAIRDKEISTLKKIAYMNSFGVFTWTTAPYMVTLATFITYVFISETHQLDASKAFVALALFNILRFPINLLPLIISYTIQAYVSIMRIGKFLRSGELATDSVSHNSHEDQPLVIRNGIFTWEDEEKPTLKNINLNIDEGKLVAVVGPVGCGKTSLVTAILGEMKKLNGEVNVKGSVAYVSQQAWIQHATLRDNILFSNEFNLTDYNQVLDACALRPDLSILPAGDLTEIGEKGINLSGGQKQRVSLARAVYNDADIYLLDDPLSAVDAHVGKHLFDKVIGNSGMLKNKTRVLVTNGVHWLPMVDEVVVLEEGHISDRGSYDELMQRNGAFANFIRTYLTIEAETDDDEPIEIKEMKARMLERAESIVEETDHERFSENESEKQIRHRKNTEESDLERSVRQSITRSRDIRKSSDIESKKSKSNLITAEHLETGHVSLRVYSVYAKAIGVFASFVILICYMLYGVAQALGNVWLSKWTEDPVLQNTSSSNLRFDDTNYFYMGIYGGLGGVQAFFILIYSLTFSIKQVQASKVLHVGMLKNVLRNPMSFFDMTPIGRIVNRFSRDIETIDNNLPTTIRQFFNTFFNVVITILVISVTTPLFLVVIIPLLFFYYFVQRFYIPTSRQLKRIESTTRSPIYNHFGETIQGATTIRAYSASNRFMCESDSRVDNNLIYYFAGIASNRWLGIRLELAGNILVVAAALFAVLGRDTLSGGLVGLSVSYALQVTNSLNWAVRMTSDLETNVVSVERIKEYSETTSEAPWDIPETRPKASWPENGEIEFVDYSTRYRQGLDLVLRGIKCRFQPGEKIGVVGRTGAGKSSLTLALFRLIESVDGYISIDNEVISKLGLHALRSRLTILPQDPVLFSGTLRMNLDPFDQYGDAEIWQALETANMKSYVSDLPQQLQHECGEGGSNLSVGQRQLICLARTLLRKTKILILDEATAAVDMETDDLIQQAIRTEFADCTVVTIAHRLNTILDYDRVMVLDKGSIIEFDEPTKLLTNPDTVFYSMAKDAGLVH